MSQPVQATVTYDKGTKLFSVVFHDMSAQHVPGYDFTGDAMSVFCHTDGRADCWYLRVWVHGRKGYYYFPKVHSSFARAISAKEDSAMRNYIEIVRGI